MNSNPNWATDVEFQNRWAGHQGVIIGRGLYGYQREPAFDKFNGVKIGCNHAYRVTSLDALVWMDACFFDTNWPEIAKANCYKFAIDPVYYDHHSVTIYGLEVKKPEKCAEYLKDGFYPCNLSGYIALNLALIFGLNRIWLHGFSPNTQELMKRSESFGLIAKWAAKNEREIYVTDQGSWLTKFFPWKNLSID